MAISGVSGSGKTTLVKLLSEHFSCPYLLFDDYVEKHTYPKDMKAWLHQGANLSELKTPGFVKALKAIKQDNAYPYVFIEEPFARCRESIAVFIDVAVFLDTPLEVCLSRVIQRNFEHANGDSATQVLTYLTNYDDHLREIYIETAAQAKSTSDFVVDGNLSTDATTKLLKDWLNNN
ncbi:AAA family ATPase [Planctobacterium marinum]|uniref:AAA family ATPase n=1 Tax=Planctobacterium marinum TaxID=1631968 RepID=UPI0030C761CE